MSKGNLQLLAVSCALASFLQFGNSSASSLTGNTGLVTIPTAEILENGEIHFGLNWLDKKYVPYAADRRNVIVSYFAVGYLPFLEVSLRLTRLATMHPPPSHIGIGDRMVCAKLRLYNESKILPSIVLGIHDPFGNSFFYSSYMVMSKSYAPMDFHLGYGIGSDRAVANQFVGLFGGASLSPSRYLTFMLEYDGEKFNCGARISPFGCLDLLLALLNFDTFSAGVNFRFRV